MQHSSTSLADDTHSLSEDNDQIQLLAGEEELAELEDAPTELDTNFAAALDEHEDLVDTEVDVEPGDARLTKEGYTAHSVMFSTFLIPTMVSLLVVSGMVVLSLALQTSGTPLYFAFVGDAGRRGGWNQTQVAQQMSNWCSKTQRGRCDFSIFSGDNFYENGVTSLDQDDWKASFEDVYSQQGLKDTRLYQILGNHDYRSNPDVQVQYTSTRGRQKPLNEPAYRARWYMPSHYYSSIEASKKSAESVFQILKYGETKVLFMFLDTSPMVEKYMQDGITNRTALLQADVSKQLAWIKKTLQEHPLRKKQPLNDNAVDYKIIVAHHPMHSFGYHGNTVEVLSKIENVLFENDVLAYFAGHNHLLEYIRTTRPRVMHHVVSGAGSRTDVTRLSLRPYKADETGRFSYFHSSFFGVRLDRLGMQFTCVNWQGEVCGGFFIPNAWRVNG